MHRCDLVDLIWCEQAREIGMLHAEKRALEADKGRLKSKVKDLAAAVASVQVGRQPCVDASASSCRNTCLQSSALRRAVGSAHRCDT
jgi:uncharacterized protein YlxW (UPF0749 family)